MGTMLKSLLLVVALFYAPVSIGVLVQPYYRGLQMGIGADSRIGRVYGTALELTDTKVEDYADGQETEWKLTQVSTTEELNTALGIRAEASTSSWGVSVSASASFSKTTSVNKFTTNLLVRVSVKNAVENIPRPRLSTEATEFLTKFGLIRFQKVYGSEYLGGVISGGTYLGMITVHTLTQKERTEITAGIKFSGYGSSLKLQTSYAAEKIMGNRTIEVYGVQIGGQPQSLATTIEDMVQQLREFPSQVLSYPVPIEGIFHKYQDTIPYDWSGDAIDFRIRNRVLQNLGLRSSALKDRKNDLEYVRNNYYTFEELREKPSSERLKDLEQIRLEINEIISESNSIDEVGVDCTMDTEMCKEPPANYTPVFQLPEQAEDYVSESAGMAMMFFGNVKDIPYGWQLCDGSSLGSLTTPDLRGKFPLGHSIIDFNRNDRVNTNNIQTGGKQMQTLSVSQMPQHSHSMQSAGNHAHTFDDYYYSEFMCEGAPYRNINSAGFGAGNTDRDNHAQCYYTHTSYIAGAHSHKIDNNGQSQAFEILPPYTAVYFICRIK